MIKRKQIDISEERRILSHMITSTRFLDNLKEIAEPRFFKSQYSQIVARWIWEFHEHTQEAPGKHIEDIYIKYQSDLQNQEEENELIAEFLGNLSEDWSNKIQNVKYTIKNAIEYFKLRHLDQIKEELDEAVKLKNIGDAERIIADYTRIDKVKSQGVDLLADTEKIRNAFMVEHDYLFKFPSELGKCVGTFERGDFFAIMGAPKKGKSWWLIYTAVRALLAGLKVVYINLEMTEAPVIRRFWQCLNGESIKKETVDIPQFEMQDSEKYSVVQNKVKKKGIDLEQIKKHQTKYLKAIRTGQLKIQTFPSDTATVKDLQTYLRNLEYYEGFVPDVLVVDYADILRAENTRNENRHQINDIWKALRGIAQDKEIMVATATQTDRKGIDKDAGASNVAEDMRKITHITKMMIINQNEKEKEDGILRAVLTHQREGQPYKGEVVVLENRGIGRPYLSAMNIKKVDLEKYKNK